MKKKGSIVGRVVIISSVMAAIIAMVISLVGILGIRNVYLSLIEEELKAATELSDSEFSYMWDGDWAYEDGVLTKGGQEVYDEYLETILENKELTNLDYTIFFGDTRAVTSIKDADSGEYVVGTTASEEVVQTVINGGENAYMPNIIIQGEKYYGYYTPLENDDGTIVGMMFSGRESSDVQKQLNIFMIIMIAVFVLGMIVIVVAGVMSAKSARKAMNGVAKAVEEVANGDLSAEIPAEILKRTDEVGFIAYNVNNLMTKLHEVISVAKGLSEDVANSGDELANSSDMATAASGQVTCAVDDISRGAVNQAESVQDSASNIDNISNDIVTISDDVSVLLEHTDAMGEACKNSMKALEELMAQNSEVVSSMGEIDVAIKGTNDAVKNISDATKLISDIASQTNLLALNAAIEAARAGESGRGFAVVAEEIGALADQSAKTANEINEIVNNLTEESLRSVDTIEKLNGELEQQSQILDRTRSDMDKMENGVVSVSESTEEIAGRVKGLEEAKTNLVSIIEDLSAISEENAASTEETNASMQELNATFELISHSAGDLKTLAVQLEEQISYFNVEK
ncbi:MAG: methyl-accepting chemotaxis protein [Eubacterium sp.]|nr:methyl-accepting chemotaxis protein [Eubacterium sp.]